MERRLNRFAGETRMNTDFKQCMSLRMLPKNISSHCEWNEAIYNLYQKKIASPDNNRARDDAE